ncbi:hypothetical protein H4R19_004731 [Coemansia spiralis]|nr:hypothetical protein H4R19_004731 [Coemansia spiralis]
MMGDLYNYPGAPQMSSEEALCALNALFATIPPTAPAQQVSMASSAAPSLGAVPFAGYPCALPAEAPAFGCTPLVLSPVEITPTQSTQQQLPLSGLDVAAVSASMGGSGISNAELAALLGASIQQPLSAASDAFGLPTAPTTASDCDLFASLGVLAPQVVAGDGTSFRVGVPLGKRVSLPISLGPNIGAGCAPSVAMNRRTSHQPAKAAATLIADPFSPEALLVCKPLVRASTTTETSSRVQSDRPVAGQFHRKVAHNAIERRYRNNINDRIRDLRNSVPALETIQSKRWPSSADDTNDSADDQDDAGDTHVDGVEAATKLNKATILGKATEYIYYLRRANDQQRRESLYLQQYIGKLPGGEAIIQKLLQNAKRESAAATADLCMPEPAPKPKRRKLSSFK